MSDQPEYERRSEYTQLSREVGRLAGVLESILSWQTRIDPKLDDITAMMNQRIGSDRSNWKLTSAISTIVGGAAASLVTIIVRWLHL